MNRLQNLVRLLTVLLIMETSTAQTKDPALEKRDTVFTASDGTEVHAEVGALTVPERRASKRSRLIAVNYIRLKSFAGRPGAPLLFLEGGSTRSTWQAAEPEYLQRWLPYLEISDVILYDQRGVNDEDRLWLWEGAYPEDFMVSAEAAADHWQAMAARALPVFEAKGIDLLGYTITESAHDIAALRNALHLEKISLLGFSFGAKLGMTLIKLYGDHIENAVLAGVPGMGPAYESPSDLDTQFEKLAQQVARDEQLRQGIPDLVALLERVMEKLDKDPIAVTALDPLSRQPMQVKVGPFGLALILRSDLGDAFDLPVIPRLLYSMDQGDGTVLQWFVQKRIVWAYGVPGMDITMSLAPEAADWRWEQVGKEAAGSIFKNVANFPFFDIKDVWPDVPMDVDFSIPVASDVRTLLLSGEWDYNTPPFQAEKIKWGFSNATHLVVRHAGHEQILSNDTIKKTILRFLRGEAVHGVNASHKALKFIPLTGTSEQVSHPSVVEH